MTTSQMVLITTPACMVCGRESEMVLEKEKVDRYLGGEFVQNVWPELPIAEREMLITGIHGKCWDEMMGRV